MRDVLGSLVIRLHKRLPTFRGKQALTRVAQQALGGPCLQTTQEGIQLATRLTSSMDLSFLSEGGHSLIRREINLLRPGDTFLDIGANTGYFSLLASRRIGPTGWAMAIEPSSREFALLLRNIEANQAKNVVALNCAAANGAALVQLEVEAEHTGLNKISDAAGSAHSQLALAYAVETLLPAGLHTISLVKVDTEGYELFALRGLQRLLTTQAIKKLVVEVSPEFLLPHGQRPDDIYGFLEGHGYAPSPHTNRSGKQWDEVFTPSQALAPG